MDNKPNSGFEDAVFECPVSDPRECYIEKNVAKEWWRVLSYRLMNM